MKELDRQLNLNEAILRTKVIAPRPALARCPSYRGSTLPRKKCAT